MKTNSLLGRTTIVSSGFVLLVAIMNRVATMSVSGASLVIGGALLAGILGLMYSDYSRKPQFRVRSHRSTLPRQLATPKARHPQAACDWTYTTRAA